MKGETQKICPALLAFEKNTIIPMLRWRFERAEFRLNPSDLLGPATVDPIPVIERIDVLELPFDGAFLYPERLRPEQLQQLERRRRERIPGRMEFAINLIAYVDATIGKCPLCSHEEDEEASDEEEASND
jgi:hypothetical protein